MGYIRKSEILMWEQDVINSAPDIAGVYVLRDLSQSIVYIGSAGAGASQGTSAGALAEQANARGQVFRLVPDGWD